MNSITGFLRRTITLEAAIVAVLALSFAGNAWAIYLNDAATEKPAGSYHNPNDGFCVSGLKTDGTMTVVPGITNFRDCVAYTTGLAGLTATDVTANVNCPTSGIAPYNKPCNVAANCSKVDGSLTFVAALQKCFDTSACTVAGATNGDAFAHACVASNDGAKHTYSSSLCINAASRAGISRVDLDNTAATCQEKGGVLADGLFGHPYGACSAYGWVYGGVKSDGTLPDVSAGKGVKATDNLGFCYTSMRMTSAPGNTAEGTGTGCPSWHNVTAKAGAEWAFGAVNDGVKYQSQASYDAGLGWSFASSQCVYAYGVQGYINADLRGPDGVIAPAAPLCGGGTVAATAGTCLDLTGIATQGQCLAIGGTWDNWLPVGNGAAPYAANVPVATAPLTSTIKKLDAITTLAAGGGKFYSGTGSVCLKCHSDQSRAYQERQKPGYVDTGHKLSGDTAAWGTVGNAWGLKGAQCEICHATGKATAQDLGAIIYQTKICVGGTEAASTACDATHPCASGGTCTAGVPRAASGHNQTEYGTHVTGVCITCHGTPASPESTNPASVIPVAAGDFAPTSKNLAPIANQFLNSPHALYAGSSNKLDVVTKTNYSSTFAGNICRTGTEVTDAATLLTSTSTTSCAGQAGNGADITTLSACNCPTYGGTWNATTKKCGIVVAGSFDLANCVSVAGGTWNATTLQCDVTALNATTCSIVDPVSGVWNAVTSKCYEKVVCAGGAAKTWDAGTLRCVESLATCQAQSDSGYNFIWSTTGAAGIKSIITTSGAGCYRPFGGGSIATTYYSGGGARKIPNLDTAGNVACTSPTAGAGGFWTADGEQAGTSGSVAFPATDKGNCMTCHDVHWSLESTDPKAEPIRRECTTCHVHPTGEASASNAPQIDPTRIDHLSSTGTPLAHLATDPNESCVTCHMPKSSASGSPMHLWRINTSSTYTTMGASQANVAADGTYTNAAWVDIDHVCGQCHNSARPNPSWPFFTTGQLAIAAAGMHPATVTTNAPPVANETCVFNANTWTMTLTDTSTDDHNAIAQETVNWGDGSVVADDRSAPFGPFLHTYIDAGVYSITHQAIDDIGQLSAHGCTASPVYFTISGIVSNNYVAHTANLAGATVTVTNATTGLGVATAISDAGGAYSVGFLKPGSYTVSVTKLGFTFDAPTTLPLGPSATVNVNSPSPALGSLRAPRLFNKLPSKSGTTSLK